MAISTVFGAHLLEEITIWAPVLLRALHDVDRINHTGGTELGGFEQTAGNVHRICWDIVRLFSRRVSGPSRGSCCTP